MKKEQVVIAKVSDKIKRFQKTGEICFTNFLDPAEIIDIEPMINKLPCYFYGGFHESERKILILGIEDVDSEIEKAFKEYVEIITIESPKSLSHREVLGSLLGLGINRDILGDILIDCNRADVLVIKEMSKYILQNLEKVGREKIKVYKNSYDNLLKPIENYKELKTTVASLRLDAVVSIGIGVSREISSKLIENQEVKLNHKIIENTSKQLKSGDKISIRGYGRLELTEILGETKKDRIRVVLKKSCN